MATRKTAKRSVPAKKKSAPTPKKNAAKTEPAKKSEWPLLMVENAATPESVVGQVTQLAFKGAATVVALRVIDDASLNLANTMLVEFKKMKDLIEAKRKFFLGPMKESLKRLEGQFKVPAQKLFDADRELRNKVLAYVEAKQAKVEVERAHFVEQAQLAAEAGDSEQALELATRAVTMAETPKSMQTADSRVGIRSGTWDFEVTDFGSIPHEYFSLDEKKVKAALVSGLTDIPGIRAFKKTQLAVGGL